MYNWYFVFLTGTNRCLIDSIIGDNIPKSKCPLRFTEFFKTKLFLLPCPIQIKTNNWHFIKNWNCYFCNFHNPSTTRRTFKRHCSVHLNNCIFQAHIESIEKRVTDCRWLRFSALRSHASFMPHMCYRALKINYPPPAKIYKSVLSLIFLSHWQYILIKLKYLIPHKNIELNVKCKTDIDALLATNRAWTRVYPSKTITNNTIIELYGNFNLWN